MKRESGFALILGIALALGAAWGGAALVRAQLGGLHPAQVEGVPYPLPPGESAIRGRRLYGQLGCAACHTQQLTPLDAATATARGWGDRRTVARDYLYDAPAFLGARRVGPDLTNVGRRRPDAAWHVSHLRDPRAAVPGSLMPSYAFLSDAEAADLAAYLLSLDRSTALPEAAAASTQP